MSNMSKKLQTILMLFIFGITVALATVTGVYALSSINFNTSGGIQFGQDTYPLVLELNGGQVKGQTLTSYTYSDTVAFSLPDGNTYASKTGYTFDSWCSDEALTNKVTSIPAKTRGTKTYYAKWNANNYTLTFDANGGSVSPTSKQVTYDQAVGNLPTPTRGGYTFDAWYNSATGGTKYTSSTIYKVADNLTLFARWNSISYNITIEPDGGTIGSHDNTYKTGTSQTKTIPNPTKNGYTFTGWTVSWTDSSNHASDSLKPTINGTSTSLSIPTDCYGNITLTANWKVVDYTITYNLNSGSWKSGFKPTTKYTIESATITLPTASNIEKVGYTFAGWFEDSSFSGSAIKNILAGSTGNKTYYARWTANSGTAYTVNHYQEKVGIDSPSESTSSHWTLEDTDNLTGTTGASVTPSVKSYTGFTAPSTRTVIIAADGSTVVNYYYTRNSYKLTLNKGTGIASVSGAGTYDYEEDVLASATVSTGYTFSGWTSSSTTLLPNSSKVSYTFNMPAGAVTLTANATANKITVTFDYQGATGGNTTSTMQVTYNSTYGTLPSPTKTGYTFAGWYTSTSWTTKVTNSTKVTNASNHTLYARWTANTDTPYKVNHYLEKVGIDSPSESTSSHWTLEDTDNLTGTTGASVTPSVKSYTGFTAPSTKTVTINADGSTVVNYYYTRNSYKLTLSKGTGIASVSGAGTYDYEEDVLASATVSTGYTFSGWTSSSTTLLPNSSKVSYTFNMPAGAVTLTANATANGYVVTYNATENGGTFTSGGTGYTSTASVKYGAPVDLNTTNRKGTKDGWTFVGWNTSSTATSALTSYTMPANNVTLYAIYKKTITASFYQLNSTTAENKSVTIYNKATTGSITAPALSTQSGLTIVGWGTATNSTTSSVGSGASVSLSNSTTYYAVYKYTVSVSYNGNGNTSGSTSGTSDTAYKTANKTANPTVKGITISLATNGFTKTGYTFSKWAEGSTSGTQYTAGTERTLTASTTYYAIWTPINVTISASKTSATLTYGYSTTNIATITASGGGGRWTYSLVESTSSYFALSTTSATTSSVTLKFNAGANAGTYTVKVKATSTYNSQSATTEKITVTVNKRALTITADSASKVYDGNPLTKNTFTSSGLLSGHTISSCTVTGTITNVGTVNNVPSNATVKSGSTNVTSNYQISYTNGTLTVTKANGYITIDPTSSSITYGTSSKTFTVTSNHGGTLSATDDNSTAQVSISETTVTVSSLGSITAGTVIKITVTCAATQNYNAASAVHTLTVNKANISPKVSMSGYTYGGTKSNPSITGNPGNGSVTYYYNTTNSNSGGTPWTNVTSSKYLDVGTYYMYAVVSATTNYNGATTPSVSFTISKGTVTAPTTLSVNKDGIVTWSGASNATAYQISINGTSWTSASSGVNYLSTIIATTGTRTIYVRAINSDSTNYATPSSNKSTSVVVYTLTINSNNTSYGTVSSSSIKVISGSTYTTSSNVLTVTRQSKTEKVTATPTTNNSQYTYSFSSWSSTSGTISANTTVTANFTRTGVAYTITYSANGGTGTNQTQNVSYGTSFTTKPSTTFTRSGYTFVGWSTSASAWEGNYKNANISYTYTNTSSITLYAIWRQNASYMPQIWKPKISNVNSLTQINFVNSNSGLSGTQIEIGVTSSGATWTSSTTSCYGLTAYLNGTILNIYSPYTIYAPVDCGQLFNNLPNLVSINFGSNFNTSRVTSMLGMFSACDSLTTLTNISNFDTSNVTNMATMFYGCESLVSINLENFKTTSVKSMQEMFSNCTSLTSLDLYSFQTEKVTNMEAMFKSCQSLKTIYWSDSFVTNSVTTMYSMFADCQKLEALDLSLFVINSGVNIDDMLYVCGSLKEIKTPKTVASGVTITLPYSDYLNATTYAGPYSTITNANQNTTLKRASEFRFTITYNSNGSGQSNQTQNVSYGTSFTTKASNTFTRSGYTFVGWSTSASAWEGNYKNANVSYTYTNTTNITLYAIWRQNVSYLNRNWQLMINNLESVKSIEFRIDARIDTSDIQIGATDITGSTSWTTTTTSCYGVWAYVSGTTLIIRSPYTIYAPQDSHSLFSGPRTLGWQSNLTSLILSNFDTSKVTNMSSMFLGCSSLTSLDLSDFNTSKVTDMSNMFNGCTNLSSITFGSSFVTDNVTNMDSMFSGCRALTNIDLTDFNTSKVTNMAGMFYECLNLTTLNLTNFNTTNVTDMSYMFSGCSKLTSIGFRENFLTTNVRDMTEMFALCRKLSALDIRFFTIQANTTVSFMLSGCDTLIEIKTPYTIASGVTITLPYSDYLNYTTYAGPYSTITNANQNTTLKRASQLTFTIDINENGGVTVANQTYQQSSTSQTKTITVPVRKNYIFNGWTIDWGTGGHSSTLPKPLKTTLSIPANCFGNISLTAQWKAAEAKIGSTYYDTLESAINAATSGQTVEIVASNIVIDSPITISKTLTITTASGVTSTVKKGEGCIEDVMFTISSSGNLEIKGSSESAKLTIDGCNLGVSDSQTELFSNKGTLTTGENLTLSRGYAGGLGGIITNSNVLEMNGTICINGHAINSDRSVAGAIYNFGDAIITGCTFENNYGDYGTGAISNDGGNLTLTNCIFNSNYTVGDNELTAGAVRSDYGTLKIEGCTFYQNNNDNGYGGAIAVVGGTATISGCTFEGNSANNGGAIYASTSQITISTSEFNTNNATISGGAVYLGKDSHMTLNSASFITNSAGSYGAAIYSTSAGIIMESSTTNGIIFKGNTNAKTVFVDNSEIRISQNCFFDSDQSLDTSSSTLTINLISGGQIKIDTLYTEATPVNVSETHIEVTGGVLQTRFEIGTINVSGTGIVVNFKTMLLYNVFYDTFQNAQGGDKLYRDKSRYSLITGLEARIGTGYYATLESAVSAAATLTDPTVYILATNIQVTSTMQIANDITICSLEETVTITRGSGSYSIFNITSGDVKIGTSGKMIIFDGTVLGNKLTKTVINITRKTSKTSNLTLGSYVTFQNFYLQTSNGAVINSTGYTIGARNYEVLITISGAQFLSNRASNQGAVIYPAYTDITISSGTFDKNYTTTTSNSYGGVVYLPSNTSLTVEGGTFTNNYADRGGVFYVAGGTLSISNGSFSGNGKKPDQPYSTTYGDIIYLSSGTATISGGTLNTPGNAIYVAGTAASMLKISGGTIQTQTDNDYAINLYYGRNLQISGSPTIVGKGSNGTGSYDEDIFVRNHDGSLSQAVVLGGDFTGSAGFIFDCNLQDDYYLFKGTYSIGSSLAAAGYGYSRSNTAWVDSKPNASGYTFDPTGCFATDTYVTVWDEKKKKLRRKKAKKLTYKDKLLVWNFDKGCFDFANPLWIQKEEVADKYTLITFSDGSKLKVVEDHAVFNYDKQFFCPICSNESWGCPVGTRVVKYDGSIVTIVNKKVVNKKVEYTNILTKYHMNVYASGILTSTPFNNMYKVENMKYVKDEVKECKNLTLLEGISDEWIDGMRLKEYPDHILIAGIKHFANCKTFKDYIDMKIKEQKFD